MTTNSNFDRQAAAFMADGPTELADRVLDAALHEVHVTTQRRGLVAPWRLPRMHGIFRLATASVAVLVAIVGSAYIVSYRPSLGPAAVPTATPVSASATAACGHELAQGLYLTAGCTYLTSDMRPGLSITSDGSWLDSFQSPNALDFVANAGRARNATVRIRPLRAVLADACAYGSGDRLATTPKTARAYLDWLGAFIFEPRQAVEASALGLHGWQFDVAAPATPSGAPIPSRSDTCNLVSLAEPPVATSNEAEALVIDQQTEVRVYVLDTDSAVLLVTIEFPDSAALGASEAFLAAMHTQP